MFYLPEIFLQCSANGTSEMIMKHDPNILRRPPVQPNGKPVLQPRQFHRRQRSPCL